MKKTFLIITLIVAAMALSACAEDTPEARRTKRREIGARLAEINVRGSNLFYDIDVTSCTVKELEQIGKALEDGFLYTHEIDQDLFYKLLYENSRNLECFADRPSYKGSR